MSFRLLIMQALRDLGTIDLRDVHQDYAKADEREVVRALQVLLAEGLIERASTLSSAPLDRIAASQGGMRVTDAGYRWLGEKE